MRQLVSQSWFEVRRNFRNRQFIFSSLLMPIIFYFIFLKVDGANQQVDGTSWKAYFLMSMSAFSVIGSSLFSLSSRIAYERTQGWFTLVRTTPLSSNAYVFGKIVAQWITMALSVALIFVIGGWSQAISLAPGQWLGVWLWLTFGALPFMALGLLIGVAINVEATYLIANILYLVLAVLGGLWFPIQIMPATMQHIAKWLPTYRFAHVAWNTIAGVNIQASDLLIVGGYTVVFLLLTGWVLRLRAARNT